jgi:hypothetical protein
MISRFNYTDRKRIRHKMAIIVVDDGPPRSFDAKFNFEGIELPADGKIYVEAMSGARSNRAVNLKEESIGPITSNSHLSGQS